MNKTYYNVAKVKQKYIYTISAWKQTFYINIALFCRFVERDPQP